MYTSSSVRPADVGLCQPDATDPGATTGAMTPLVETDLAIVAMTTPAEGSARIPAYALSFSQFPKNS